MRGPLQFIPPGSLTPIAKLNIDGTAAFGKESPIGAFRIHGKNPTFYITNETPRMSGDATTIRLVEEFEGDGNVGGFLSYDGFDNRLHIGVMDGVADINSITLHRDTGNVGIRNPNPEARLHVGGDVKVDGKFVGNVGIGKTPDLLHQLDVEGGNIGINVTTLNKSREALIVNAPNVEYAEEAILVNVGRAGVPQYSFFAAFAAGDRKFVFQGDGIARADQAFDASLGADYAEYFCGTVGDTEIPVGSTVVLEGDNLRAANEGEDPIGVTRPKSGGPGFIGDSGWTNTDEKYLRDDYGAYVMEDVVYVKWLQVNEDGETVEKVYHVDAVPPEESIPETAQYFTQKEQKLNPNFDPNKQFIPKEQRSDCYVVGLLGKVPITKGQPVGKNWIKMREISETVELWLMR